MGYAVDFYNVSDRARPEIWAAAREAEGWSALGVGDHITFERRWALHAFACLGAMAVRTERVSLATMFADNLVRSPVEFADRKAVEDGNSGGVTRPHDDRLI